MFAIIGVNTIGTIAAQLIRSRTPDETVFYVDDDVAKINKVFNGIPVSSNTKDLFEKIETGEQFNLTIAFGEKLLSKKQTLFQSLKKFKNVTFPILKHPSALVSDLATIGEGNILSFGTIVSHGTILKPNSVLWSGAVIEHDCVIGECCYIAPNVTVSGFVTIGDCSLIGSGATILPEVKIGSNCIIGAGAVVTKDVSDNSVVAGIPAKKIR